MTFTAREKYEDALREVKLRERVYQRMVNVGDLSKELAAKRVAIMSEIAFEYKELMKQEDLFGEDALSAPRAKAHRRYSRPPDRAGPDHAGEPRQEAAAENGVAASPAEANQGRTGDGDTGPSGDLPNNPGREHG